MQKAVHGAFIGLLVGGPATLVALTVVNTALETGNWTIWAWIFGWTVWGAILGALLPRHK